MRWPRAAPFHAVARCRPLRKLAGDSELRREMGLRGAAAWREKYSWDRMEERLLALYARLLATPEVP